MDRELHLLPVQKLAPTSSFAISHEVIRTTCHSKINNGHSLISVLLATSNIHPKLNFGIAYHASCVILLGEFKPLSGQFDVCENERLFKLIQWWSK